MSTAKRRRGHSLHLDLPNDASEELPPVAALFEILFDVKAGYTIAWKTSISGLELNESVEFKSLPSGLHNVEEDLVYFVHNEDFAGISAFVNAPAESSERHALMLAVGALLPLSHGRLGKSWKHAAGLKELARRLSSKSTDTSVLDEYWDSHRLRDEEQHQEHSAQPDSPTADKAKRRQSQALGDGHVRSRKRAVTAASALAPPGQTLSPHHPALSLPQFLDTFGPLIFPLYKAALLRKRILLLGNAPVEQACNFVYDISILSGIPSSVSDLLPLEPLPTRLLPLFAVGVHDMQSLAQGSRNQPPDSKLTDDGMGYGWVANTTDDILSHKTQLYDTLVTIPPSFTTQAKQKVWPKLEIKRGGPQLKATQRDLRRYHVLRREIRRFPNSHASHNPKSTTSPPPQDDLPFIENTQETYDDASSTLDAELAEPQSWSALAYNSFVWWASAGEKRTDLDEEEEYDAALLQHTDASPYHDEASPMRPRSAARKSPGRSPMTLGKRDTQTAGLEMTIIAYFHRLTTLILKTLADIIDASDYEDEDAGDARANGNAVQEIEDNEDAAQSKTRNNESAVDDDDNVKENQDLVFINAEDMSRMGLDVWSESDREFVKELVELYWGRKADVSGGRVECCGVRIC